MRKYSAYTWDLVWALKSVSTDSSNTPATSRFQRPKQTTKKKQKLQKVKSRQIKFYGLGLSAQDPGLREVDFGLSPMNGSDKIKKLGQRKKNATKNKLNHPAWTHEQDPNT